VRGHALPGAEVDHKHAEVLGFAEGAIVGIFSLVGRTVRTAVVFFFSPDRLWDTVRLRESSCILESTQYTSPLTFLVLTLTSWISLFSLYVQLLPFRSNPVRNQFFDLFVAGLKDLNEKKLLLALLPLLLVVGLFAWAVHKAARKYSTFGFERSLALAAYSAGSVCCIYIIVTPFMPRMMQSHLIAPSLSELPAWAYALSLIGWGTLIKCLHSYLHLLRRELRTSRCQTVVVWLGGTVLFFAVFGSIMAWLAPLLYALAA